MCPACREISYTRVAGLKSRDSLNHALVGVAEQVLTSHLMSRIYAAVAFTCCSSRNLQSEIQCTLYVCKETDVMNKVCC